MRNGRMRDHNNPDGEFDMDEDYDAKKDLTTPDENADST